MAQWEKGCVYINGIWIIWISPTYSSKYGLFSLSMTGVGNRQYSKSHLDQFPTKKRTHWEPQTHLTSKIKIILHISFFTSMLWKKNYSMLHLWNERLLQRKQNSIANEKSCWNIKFILLFGSMIFVFVLSFFTVTLGSHGY